MQVFTTLETIVLGYQSLGVVYGDLGTSPLYVFSSIKLAEPTERDLLGILSIIFWTLTLMGLLKYVLIVLRADDHGEGTDFFLKFENNYSSNQLEILHFLSSFC